MLGLTAGGNHPSLGGGDPAIGATAIGTAETPAAEASRRSRSRFTAIISCRKAGKGSADTAVGKAGRARADAHAAGAAVATDVHACVAEAFEACGGDSAGIHPGQAGAHPVFSDPPQRFVRGLERHGGDSGVGVSAKRGNDDRMALACVRGWEFRCYDCTCLEHDLSSAATKDTVPCDDEIAFEQTLSAQQLIVVRCLFGALACNKSRHGDLPHALPKTMDV